MTANQASITTLARLLRRSAAELAAEPVPALQGGPASACDDLPAEIPVLRAAPAVAALRPWRARNVWPWAGAAACVLLMIGSAWLMLGVPVRPVETLAAQAPRASGFVPLLPLDHWPSGGQDASPAWVVSAEMPSERLAALGLPYDPGRAGETVRAELLMRASGEVLAVRFVR